MAKFAAVGKASPQRKAVKGICFSGWGRPAQRNIPAREHVLAGMVQVLWAGFVQQMGAALCAACTGAAPIRFYESGINVRWA
jgi:hypothetical protein